MMKTWLTDDEKKLIRIITAKSGNKAERLKKYLISMQHVSVIGEEKEILEDTVNELLIKIRHLDQRALDELIESSERDA